MYIAQVDIVNRLTEEVTRQLTDEEGLGEVNTSRLDEAIASACAIVDGYCMGRYRTPFNPIPEIIKSLTLDVAIFKLYERASGITAMPEVRQNSYDSAVAMLKDISKGVVALAQQAAAAPATQSFAGEVKAKPAVFTRDNMEGF